MRALRVGTGLLMLFGLGCSSGGPGGKSGGGAGATAGVGGGAGASAGVGGPGGAGGASGAAGMTMAGVPKGAPVVFFTDLASAPPGAFVTLWGRGFGATQGASKVMIGDAAASVVSWSDTMLEIRLPATSGAGALVVTTGAGASPGLSFGSHAGKIYFVAPNGDDTWTGTKDAPAGGDGPWKTLAKAKAALKAGDVLYLRAATYTAMDQYSAVLSLRDVPTGTADKPLAIVAYPGEKVVFGDGTLLRGFSLYRGDNGPDLDYLTIAKLEFRPSCDAVELIQANNGRFVGNEVHGASDACMNGVVEAQGSSGWKILGNHLHDNGNTKLEHGVYLGGYGTQSDWEIAWNTIGPQKGGRAIQLYGHTMNNVIQRVSIHDNEIVDVDRDGIVLGATDGDVLHLTDIRITNNVFHRAGRCVGYGVRVGNDTATGVAILNNTFYDNGSGKVACDQSAGQAGGQVLIEAAVSVDLRDDLLVSVGAETYVSLTMPTGSFTDTNDLFFGAGAAPAWATAAVAGDPLFVDAAGGDFHLGAGSPASGAGVAAGVTADRDGVARPAKPAIGAYEP